MFIKRVFLPLCDDKGIAPLIKSAFFLGRMFSAEVSSLLVQRLPVVMPAAAPGLVGAETLRQITENAGEKLAEMQKRTQDIVEDHARGFPEVASAFASGAEPISQAVRHGARLADIVVLGRGKAYDSGYWREIRDAALFESGRPVLLVPPDGVTEQNFDRVVIAWKESIEATRAITAAQPFLTKAKEVYLTTIGKDHKVQDTLLDFEQYLQLHYANVQSETIAPSSDDIGKTLLDYCEAKGGAMLVMGAYSHWRWREQLFGGVTEYMLQNANVPVLMAH
ncbi:MAG TPA: universal stress protein [Hyphomicrobiales bacterium]|nr:universal stress protein [Hyphomicrobiales bacterium]